LNAIYVSYLEHLEFDTPIRGRAKQFMSARLLQGWQDIMSYLDQLANLANKNSKGEKSPN